MDLRQIGCAALTVALLTRMHLRDAAAYFTINQKCWQNGSAATSLFLVTLIYFGKFTSMLTCFG